MMAVMSLGHINQEPRSWHAALRRGLVGGALRHRPYRLFFCGQAVSLMGSWMQNLAQGWLVYRLTGSAEMLGVVAFAGQIPVLVFGLLGGTLAESWPRRRLIMATQGAFLVQAAALAALTLTGLAQVWQVVALAVVFGMINAVDIPARQAFTVDLVGKTDLGNAVALDASIFNAARLVAPAVAGAMVARLGEGWCFALNAASFLAVLAALAVMGEPAHQAAPPPSGGMMGRVAEGLRFVAGQRAILALVALLGLSGLLGMSFSVLMPVFADRVLEGGPETLGLLMSGAGAGALLASLAVAGLGGGPSRARVAWGMVGFGAALVAFSLSRVPALSAGLLALAGMALVAHNTASQTLVQTLVPDSFRARTMALYSMTFMAATPLGALLAGVLAERIGPQAMVAMGGAACLLGGLVYRRWAS